MGSHYELDVDASDDQLGCCFLQQKPDVTYLSVGFSRPLLPAEMNYLVTKVEALGVVWAVTDLKPDRPPMYEELAVLAMVTRSAEAWTGRSDKHRPLGPISVGSLMKVQAQDPLCQKRRKEWEAVPQTDP